MNLKPCPRCKQNYFDSASGICLRCDKVNEDDIFYQLQEANKRIAELEADNHRMLTAISEAMKGIGFCSTRGEDYAFECLRSARDNTKAPDALGEQQ